MSDVKSTGVSGLTQTLEVLSANFDEFIGACLDQNGKVRAPDQQALDKARAGLPVPKVDSSSNEAFLLSLALRAVTENFADLLDACVADNGSPRAPVMKDVMRARACLPPSCKHAFTPKAK